MAKPADWSLNPKIRSVLSHLPLPIKLPTPLHRPESGADARPFAGTRAVVTRLRDATDSALCARLALHGASVSVLDPCPAAAALQDLSVLGVRHTPWTSDLTSAIQASAARLDRRPLLLVHRLPQATDGDPAVNGATDSLFHVGQAVAQAPARSRLLVLTDPVVSDALRGHLAVAAAHGCLRSLFKELGPSGGSCHLLRLEGASADAVADVAAFLLGPQAAFLTALDLRLCRDVGTDTGWAGKVALVTGAGRGIGASIAARLARAGATVWVNDVPQAEESARRTVERIGGSAFVLPADCSTAAGAAAIAAALGPGGRLDAVIHNAGITRDRTLKRLSIDQWRQVLTVNLGGMLRVQQAVHPLLRPGAAVVLMSSVMGQAGNFGQTNYTAAKAGVLELTRQWSQQYAPLGIRANAIAPGFILTDMTAHMPLMNKEMAKQLSAMLQPGLPEDVAELAAFLAGPASRAITGQTLRCDGGMFLGA